ncbi:MAG: hypothetical protein MK132_21320 [Lentisphaerales bacterium]|nr:hypothetical protein [Lentisphaerales bacterium]
MNKVDPKLVEKIQKPQKIEAPVKEESKEKQEENQVSEDYLPSMYLLLF